jgi:type IV pilus assembly protein PilW
VEAQSNGALALFLLERDIDKAGYGFMALQGCQCDDGVSGTPISRAFCEKNSSDTTIRAQSAAPITITDGGGDSDSIFVQYGTPLGGLSVNSVLAKQDPGNFVQPFQLKSVAGIVPNEILVLNRAGNCAAYQATAVTESDKTISHDADANTINPAAPPSSSYDTAWPNDQIVNLGHYVSKNFHVDANAAQLIENTSPTYTNDTPVVDNIVYMKADLGIDTGTDKLVDSWQKPANIADYSKVLAIRIGIVARNQVIDRESPTPDTLVVLPAINGGTEQTYAVPDKKYRYKVYYTIIPLRNMLWN